MTAMGVFRGTEEGNTGVLAGRCLLLVIIGIGILLRTLGLGWGIPRPLPADATPYRTSFHLDERTYIAGLISMKPGAGNFDVHDYHWGTLQFYLVGVALAAARLAGYLPTAWKQSYLGWDPLYFPRIYIVGRSVSAVAGTLTLVIAFLIGRQLEDTDTGLIAAAFLSVVPIHVVNSHFLTSDITMVFSLLVAFFFFLAWLRSGHAFSRFAGAAALGLAISAKYNAAFLLPLWIAGEVMCIRDRTGQSPKSSVLACTALLAGFAVGEPYVFIHVRAFFDTIGRAVFFSSEIAREAMLPWPRLLLEQLQAMLRFGMQWTLALPALAGFALCLVRPTKQRLALAGSVVLTLASLVFARWPMIRYTLPLVCLGIIAAALALAEMPVRRSLRLHVAALLCTVPLLVSLAQVKLLLGTHPANRASEWIYTNIPAGARIGQIWPELPPLDRRRYDLVQLQGLFDRTPANDSSRDFLILDNLPIRPLDPDFLQRLNRDYLVAAEFHKDAGVGPWVLDEPDAPHDWKYTHPVLTIYRRKTGASDRASDTRPDRTVTTKGYSP